MDDEEEVHDSEWLEKVMRLFDEPEGIEPEPGDTVLEYRDGEACICAVSAPDSAAGSAGVHRIWLDPRVGRQPGRPTAPINQKTAESIVQESADRPD